MKRAAIANSSKWEQLLKGLLIFSVLLCLSACQTVPPLAPINLQEPGWTIREGQAVWRMKRDAPEIAGEILLATRPGQEFVQFSKNPFPMMSALSSTNPTMGKGLPTTGKGLPTTGKGLPTTGKGLPTTGQGIAGQGIAGQGIAGQGLVWQVEVPIQNKRYSGRGQPPARLILLYLPRILTGQAPPKGWSFQRLENDGWRLENRSTGEMLEGYFVKQ